MESLGRVGTLVLGFAMLGGAVGCGSDAKVAPSGGGGSSSGSGCGNINYASYTMGAPVSLRADIMPIFGLRCAASSCHNTKVTKATLDLGVRCSFATGTCVFPAAVDPNDQSLAPYSPLTTAVLAATHASLLEPAKTVTSSSVRRVAPGDPEHSFLMQKVSNRQNAEGYSCTNADPSDSTVQPPFPCGDLMPLGGDPLCEPEGRNDFDKIARWIAQGALNN